MEKKVQARPLVKFGVHRSTDKPNVFVLEVQVVGETANYLVTAENLRKLADHLNKAVEQLGAQSEPAKPN